MQDTIKKMHKKKRSAWHIFGCGCGAIGIIGILIVFTFIFFEYAKSFKDPRWNRDDFATCQLRILAIRVGITNYRTDHKGSNPKKLDDLKPKYFNNQIHLNCPRENQKDAENYQYNPNAYNDSDILLSCKNHAQRIIILKGNLQIPIKNKEKLYGDTTGNKYFFLLLISSLRYNNHVRQTTYSFLLLFKAKSLIEIYSDK